MLDLAREISPVKSERDFRAMFGGPSEAIGLVFDCILARVRPSCRDFTPSSFLMTLNFLKDPGSSWLSCASRWRVDKRTLKRHIINTLQLIDFVLPEVCCLFLFLTLIYPYSSSQSIV